MLDLSVYTEKGFQLRGFAVDGVASVAVVGENGKDEAVTPVEHNVYTRAQWFPTPVRAIVALDAHGKRLYCEARGTQGSCR